MKYTIVAILMVTLHLPVFAKNRLKNGNFEAKKSCPNNGSQITYATGWDNYPDSTTGTGDYWHLCGSNIYCSAPSNAFGYQYPLSDSGYAGIYSYTKVREYLYRDLPPLIIGNSYEVSMSVSLANFSAIATNGLGVYFFTWKGATRTGSNPIPVIPQISYDSYGVITDTQNWVRLVDTFKADSAYRYLVIGNFLHDSIINTTVLNPLWPVGQRIAYYYIDSVVVRNLNDEPPPESIYSILNPQIAVFPNPFDDFIYIDNMSTGSSITLYDITGRELIKDYSVKEKINIDLKGYSRGIYFLQIKSPDNYYFRKTISKQ